MPADMLDDLVERASRAGLLRNVTLVGGEPFLDTRRLLDLVRRMVTGYGVLEIFIPTNGHWVLKPSCFGTRQE
jgi:pyruvate-formate lyase-activating enzyme